VLVTTTPTLPDCPVFGRLTPFIAGLLRTASGVSPCGVDQSISPLSRLTLTTWPYGGFTMGTPWMTVPAPNPPSAPPPPRPPPAAPAPRPPAAAPAPPAGAPGGGVGRAGAPPPPAAPPPAPP